MHLFGKRKFDFINLRMKGRALSSWIFLFTFLFLFSFRAQALMVAFFKEYTQQGNLVRYDGGDFAHVALSYKGQWLHAHPYGGVQLSPSLESLGMEDYILLEDPRIQEPSDEFVREALKKNFDIFSPWNESRTTYCSKLVGQLLNILPQPMSFESPDWQALGKKLPKGHLGLSPDDVYQELLKRSFVQVGPKKKGPSFRRTQKNRCSWYL